MSRSVILPLLGLAGIVLYGTTQAGRSAPAELRRLEAEVMPVDMGASQPLRRVEPPAAPRLRSDVDAEQAAALDSAASEEAGAADTTAAPLRVLGSLATPNETPSQD